jgi:hypothetical protein
MPPNFPAIVGTNSLVTMDACAEVSGVAGLILLVLKPRRDLETAQN